MTSQIGVVRQVSAVCLRIVLVLVIQIIAVFDVVFVIVCGMIAFLSGVRIVVTVEPILGRSARFGEPTEYSGIAHLIVSERDSEQIKASPALHCLARRFLSVTVVIAHTARKGVSCPRVEGAEHRETCVFAIPVGVVFSHESNHFAVIIAEIIIYESQQSGSISKISVVEMVVIECLRVVTCAVSDHCAPAVIACEEIVCLAGSVRQPVHKSVFQFVAALVEQLFLPHLACKHHVKGHLRESFSTPIGVRSERPLVGIALQHLLHLSHIVWVLSAVYIVRNGIIRQHSIEFIVYLQRSSLCHLQLSVRCGILDTVEWQSARGARTTILMGDEALKHVRSGSACAQVLSRNYPSSLHQALRSGILPRHFRLAGHTVSILRHCIKVADVMQYTHNYKLATACERHGHGAIGNVQLAVVGQINTVDIATHAQGKHIYTFHCARKGCSGGVYHLHIRSRKTCGSLI